ncbi:MmcQ/YjbR family DNA-binding protein [Paenibacillus sp. GD4]|uniref:MmcQ/YjbR family DNA-binding protein n=1 Tax=Paenibacillus sp. GD4 TaxID=3068890 RepID=UPI002796A7D6|nr:MmcQ/YjbR family DNA-binding protein [Paenibacillus sp. GD4]MDQ1909951.1 MmcQ/YjbR family DNA-binding protein [Paenibacillus sp. GD4]
MATVHEVRALALSLPETEEQEHGGKPSFRVRDKIYAVIQPDQVSLVIKTTEEDRQAYTTLDPEVFQVPGSFSRLAYMMVRIDRIEMDELRQLLVKAWKLVAPKRLVKAYEAMQPLL